MDIKLCECGCGQPTSISTATNIAKGVKKGQAKRFIHNHHLKGVKGSAHPNYKTGKTHKGRGYINVLAPNHKSANKNGYVLEHRLVMENHIGRVLSSSEVVHHINGNTSDNRIENLQILTQQEHGHLHNPWIKCRISECNNRQHAHGLCDGHYNRAKRHGLEFSENLGPLKVYKKKS